jgi:hypothetical protein
MPTFYMPEPFDADHLSPEASGTDLGLTRSDFKIGKMVR